MGTKGRGHTKPTPLAIVLDPLAKVIMDRGDVKVKGKKNSLLSERLSKALESRIHGPDKSERQAKALLGWATDEMNADLVT